MSLLYMSARSKRLLDVLLEQSDYLSLNHLAKYMAGASGAACP